MKTTKPEAEQKYEARKDVPETPGHVARFYGVLPRYMAGGHSRKAKKHG